MDVIRLRVNLKHVVPKVMRSLLVPMDIQLRDLHTTLQAAVGWYDCHLYSFGCHGSEWLESDFEWMDSSFVESNPIDDVSLRDFLIETGAKQFLYTYDFGDYWEHVIHVGAVTKAKAGEQYPQLTRVKGRCPPEDVGGPWGYEEFVEIMSDINHPEHEEWAEWSLGEFDVNDTREEFLRARVNNVAKTMIKGKLAK